MTQETPFKSSSIGKLKLKKVTNDQSQRHFEPLVKKIKCESFAIESSNVTRSIQAATSRGDSTAIRRISSIDGTVLQQPIISSSSEAMTLEGRKNFLSSCRLIYMKTRAYYVIKRAGFDPNLELTLTGIFQIAPELTEAAANISYFPDRTLNQLMSKVLFLYPTITNVVSATAFVFWSEDELHSYKIPLKFQAKHQQSKKPIIPGQECFFQFWDTFFKFSTCSDRVIKLENAIKNFRYALVQPASLNLSFFTHLTCPVVNDAEEQ